VVLPQLRGPLEDGVPGDDQSVQPGFGELVSDDAVLICDHHARVFAPLPAHAAFCAKHSSQLLLANLAWPSSRQDLEGDLQLQRGHAKWQQGDVIDHVIAVKEQHVFGERHPAPFHEQQCS